MLNFGFHPVYDDVAAVLQRFDFDRALVLDNAVQSLYGDSREVRTASSVGLSLPSGVYWFAGIENSLVMQVTNGSPGASTEIQVETWDEADGHPLAEAYGWAEHLWSSASPVPKPRFNIGDRAITVPEGLDVEVKSRRFSGSYWRYSVRGPAGLSEQLENKLSLIEVSEEPENWVQELPAPANRFGATLTRTKLNGKFADTVYSFRATRTVFRPYQFKPVLKMLNTGQARLLIADEVGLGKTIEAGLIWTELEARREADRVLVVCPSALLDKWRDEMSERFGFDLTVFDGPTRENFLEKHQNGNLPKRQAFVASIESLRKWDALEILENNPPDFDLVIVDEAHSMRNSSTKSYQLGAQLSEWTLGSSMVFLTATPINLGESDLNNLLGLLDPSDFQGTSELEARLAPNAILNELGKRVNLNDGSPEEYREILSRLNGLAFEKAVTLKPEFQELQELLKEVPLSPKQIASARRCISKLNTLSTSVSRTRRAEVDGKKAIRDAEPGIQIVWGRSESDFYAEFLKWCELRAIASRTPTYFSMQMPIRLASTTLKLAAQTVVGKESNLWQGDVSDERPGSWIEPSSELKDLARAVLAGEDTKLMRLRSVLQEIHSAARQALLFTWSKENLKYLFSEFQNEFRIAVLNGDVPKHKRRTIMRDFRNGDYDFLFANKVASEGLDFEFCSAVINYDLPWNPMEVEQRIGRIDRIGQKSEVILVRNFYNDEAIDSKIMFKILQRINVFEQSIGELEPIIGRNLDVLRSAIDFTLSEEQREAKAQQFLAAVETELSNARDVADSSAGLIISNDVEISGFQDQLIASGRYMGQMELANLIADWAETDDAGTVTLRNDSKIVEIIGNSTMAGRVNNLVEAGWRSRLETSHIVSDLQNHHPIQLSLDQELSRTTELDLLTANHPLVLAATSVPGHRHARYANIRISTGTSLSAGRFLVLLAHAENAVSGGDAMWGSAVDLETGDLLGETIADAVLSNLALGEITDGLGYPKGNLARLVSRARFEIEKRHEATQNRRDKEDAAFREQRRTILTEQHERRLNGIERRLQTVLERERGQNVLRMIKGQLERQKARYEGLIAELDSNSQKPVSIKYLAVCTVEVLNG